MGVTKEQLVRLKTASTKLINAIADKFHIATDGLTIEQMTVMVEDYNFLDTNGTTAEPKHVRYGKTFGSQGELLDGEMPDLDRITFTSSDRTDTGKTLRFYRRDEKEGCITENTVFYLSVDKLNDTIASNFTKDEVCAMAVNAGITEQDLKDYIDNNGD